MANAPLEIDKEQVRMLVLQVGPREAARRCNLNENTVLQWSSRYGWLEHLREEPERPKSMQPRPVINVISPVEALERKQAEDSKACRTAALSYGRSTLEAAAELAKEAPLKALCMASDVASTVKSVSIAADWQAGKDAQVLSISFFAVAEPSRPEEDTSQVIDV